METLLEESKQQLIKPLREGRRKLLIILNICYIALIIFYLTFDKLTTGSFVPDSSLYFIYLSPLFLNIVSLIYNIKIFNYSINNRIEGKGFIEKFMYANYQKIDLFIGWLSIAPIMFANFCNLVGLGNPSNDAIFADYTLSCNLIIGAVIIIGRSGALFWTVIVILVLFWDVSRLGWDYQYHYLTPAEAKTYNEALERNDPVALKRKAELEQHGLNPPKVTRYFNAWLVYIIISLMAAYFFSGITIDIFKIIPSVISNVETAIEDSQRTKTELEQKQKEITKSAMRVVRYNEIIEELNAELEKLDYAEKKKLIKVINVMRSALDKEADWEKFETNFDSVHSDFFKIIQSKCPQLTQTEMKHLAYIRINLSSAEIARLMDVKIESLRTLRYRLKKKLNLNEDIELRDYLENIEKV